MSRMIGDCLVAGGMADEPDVWTAESERCDDWLPLTIDDRGGVRNLPRVRRALRCKWAGYMPRRSAECDVAKCYEPR